MCIPIPPPKRYIIAYNIELFRILSAGTPVFKAMAAETASTIVQIVASHITVPPIGVDTRPMMLPKCNRIEKAKQKQIMSSVAAATIFKIKMNPQVLYILYLIKNQKSRKKCQKFVNAQPNAHLQHP